MRLVLVACLAAIVALSLLRRPATRAKAGAIVFWGSVLIAAAAYRGLEHTASLVDVLLFGANGRDFGDFLYFEVPLVLGYAFVLGALSAMPWLIRSSIEETGSELRKDLSIGAWRKFFARRAVWLLGVVVVIAWRWVSSRSSS